MFAISLIHRTGGSRTIMGKTLDQCRQTAVKVCAKPGANGSYIACTIPYAVYRSVSNGFNAYDVSVPFEIKSALGTELRLTLQDDD